MSLATRVQPGQRYTRNQPCRICGGWQNGPHGLHCYGILSEDGQAAHCTEIGGGTLQRNSGTDAFAHRLSGPCSCGDTHDAPAPPRASVYTKGAPAKRNLHALIPHPLPDGWHETMRFPYHAADGALLYHMVRYDPPASRRTERKRFLPYQPVGQDWAMDLEGVTRILYRLPELLAAPTSRPVFIVEGEKKVDALRKLGLVATCSPGGAGKWHLVPDAAERLGGRMAIILPDHDEPGGRHAEQVAASLEGAAKNVRVLELLGLAEGEDVVDWLARGGDAVQLLELALNTPLYAAEDPPTPTEPPVEPRSITVERELRVMDEKPTARLRERGAWDVKLRRNAHMPPLYKPFLAQVVEDYTRKPRAPGELMPISREVWGKKLGVPEKRISGYVKKAEACGAVIRKVEYTYDEVVPADPLTGAPAIRLRRSHLRIAPTDTLVQHPETLEMLGWGGKRVQYCQNIECGSDDLEVHRTVTCRACGHVQSDVKYSLNAPAETEKEPDDGEQADSTAPGQENSPGTQDGPR